jgi:hypothetical protein
VLRAPVAEELAGGDALSALEPLLPAPRESLPA